MVLTTLLYDPPDLGLYARRGDPDTPEWPGLPVSRVGLTNHTMKTMHKPAGQKHLTFGQ